MGITARYMRENVYPHLDATVLLESLEPRKRGGGRAYSLTCPDCEQRSAFYYPGGNNVVCNRRNNCGYSSSIWDVLSGLGHSNGEIVEILHTEAGVAMPEDDDRPTVGVRSTSSVIQNVLGGMLADSPAHRYLTDQRGYRSSEIDSCQLGFYPDAATVARELHRSGADMALCREWDVVPSKGKASRFDNRVVGWWQQPDGSLRLWGRAIDDAKPKYQFALGLNKSRPYGFQTGVGPTICVEGALDQYALRVLGIPACATGQNQVTQDQARYLAERGVRSIIYLADAGEAGYQGIFRTIKACEPFGITTAFSVTAPGDDDVDALRQAGHAETVHEMTDAINGGAWLAQQIIRASDNLDTEAVELLGRFYRLRSILTPESKTLHDRLLFNSGIQPCDEDSMLLMTASMVRGGLSFDSVQHQLRIRYGVNLRFEPAED